MGWGGGGGGGGGGGAFVLGGGGEGGVVARGHLTRRGGVTPAATKLRTLTRRGEVGVERERDRKILKRTSKQILFV